MNWTLAAVLFFLLLFFLLLAAKDGDAEFIQNPLAVIGWAIISGVLGWFLFSDKDDEK